MCNMSEKEGEERAPLIEETSQLLNPFVHRLELNTAYDKFKLAFMSVLVVPVRVLGIIICLIVAYILASAGLFGLSREDLAARPMTGWRRVMKELVRWGVRGVFTAGGFHLVQVKGHQAHPKEAPILAVAPHSTYFDALPIVVMGAPSVVAKGEVTKVPFFARTVAVRGRYNAQNYTAGSGLLRCISDGCTDAKGYPREKKCASRHARTPQATNPPERRPSTTLQAYQPQPANFPYYKEDKDKHLSCTHFTHNITTLLDLWSHLVDMASFLPQEPLPRAGKKIRWYLGLIGRMMMRCYGYQWIKIKGRMATRAEAPILIVGPHSSFFDAIAVYWSNVPCLVNRIENLQLPLFGKYIDYTQPVYVWREDTNSRQNTIQEIKRRATSEENWPQVMVFPEGTCTNRSCLITFKPGAFYPGVPVQPVLIRYHNRTDSFTWTWDGPGALKMLWVTLCQFHNFCELEYLPVYTPSEEEKQDAKLFANNVRQVMADALGVPVADYTYDDCRLMHKAKLKNLPCQTGLIEFQKLRHRLGLNLNNVEEELLSQYADIAITDGQITLSDFAKYLGIPESEPSLVDLFKVYDKDSSGTIDFREYLIGYCQYSQPANTEDTLKWAFKLFDRGGKGHILLHDVIKALRASLDMTPEETTRIFKQADQDNKGYITYDDFQAYAKKKPEYAKIFLTYQESIKNGTRQHYIHHPLPGKKKAD